MDENVDNQEIWEKRTERLKKYEHYKIDLEAVLNPLYNYKRLYYQWLNKAVESNDDYSRKLDEWMSETNHDIDFLLCLDQIRTSFIGPAHNFNRLVDSIIQDVFWDDIKYTIPDTDWISMGNRTSEIVLDLHNCLISIKSALDRLVKLFRLYKNGISDNCTFGHIDKNFKSKGFMSRIVQDKDKDAISEYVYQEYNKWIKECVRPRDVIIHYDDINVGYAFIEFCELPYFIYFKKEHASNSIQSENSTSTYELTFLDVYSYVQAFYDFANTIIKMIFEKLTDVSTSNGTEEI